MADDDAEPAAEPAKPSPFGGKAAPLFKKKGGAKKLFDDHKLLAISTLVGIVGLIYLVVHGRSGSTSGSTSANVSGQSTAADNVPDTGTAPSPYQMQPWWTGSDSGGGGGGMSTAGTPPASTGTPPKKKSTGAAKPQPSSHPASTAPTHSAPSSAATPHPAQLAGLYAPLSPSSSPIHAVAATNHPASHVGVGVSGNGSNVLVPFTYRAGTPPPMHNGAAPHVAAAAKRPAGTRATGHR